jgi:SAM-dependent methyltransferase
MPDQYDAIGELYERVKSLPVGLVEQSTLLAALPDLNGDSVLDVGTGTGFYPRIFKRLGAGRVVGVDSSREMITYARRIEEFEPVGIAYEVHDGGALPKLGEFDIVTAVWLLGYAEGVDALDRMIANLMALRTFRHPATPRDGARGRTGRTGRAVLGRAVGEPDLRGVQRGSTVALSIAAFRDSPRKREHLSRSRPPHPAPPHRSGRWRSPTVQLRVRYARSSTGIRPSLPVASACGEVVFADHLAETVTCSR